MVGSAPSFESNPAPKPAGDALASASNRVSLPVDRVFVVKLGNLAERLRGGCQGLVEHVISGRQIAFSSVGELLLALEISPERPTGAEAAAPLHGPG